MFGEITSNAVCFICVKWCPELCVQVKLLSDKERVVLPVTIAGNGKRSRFQTESCCT